MQSARTGAERCTSVPRQPAQAAVMVSTRREMLEKMLKERAESLSRVKAEITQATREVDEAQPKDAAMSQEARERIAEETAKADEDAKEWKARVGKLERELAIAKDYKKSVRQQSEDVEVEGFRSDGGDTHTRASAGVLSHVSVAGRPSQPLSPTGQAQKLRCLPTSAAGVGQSRFCSAGRLQGGDAPCQQQ